MTFLGFNLSVADAYGGTAASPEGFFFVFQQQPSEPRFGLEPAEASSDHPLGRSGLDQFRRPNTGGGPAFSRLPDLGNTARGSLMKNSPWRLASQVFGFVLDSLRCPISFRRATQPQRTAIVSDASDPGGRRTTNGDRTARRPPISCCACRSAS